MKRQSQSGSAEAFDPILLQILWNRLISIADEGRATLVRTAFSTAVSESNDCAVVITDAAGNSLAQNSGSPPSYVGVLPSVVKEYLRDGTGGPLAPDDILITNDPWIGSGHLPDIILVEPIFWGTRLVAFGTCAAHTSDIGGLMWAADANSVFEEGVRIPPMRLSRKGRINRTLTDLLTANVRQPEQIMGDLYALRAALRVMKRGVLELLAEMPSHDLQHLSDGILSRSERAMRTAISAVPDGDYPYAVELDGVGAPLILKMKMSVRGDRIHMDFSGSSNQVAAGINSPLKFTYAYASYPLKCALDPTTPQTEGAYRPITIEAPLGSILNAPHPAPVGARHLTGQCVSNLVLAGLSLAMPKLAVAEAGSTPALRVVFSGERKDNNRFTTVLFASGGMGGGSTRDGQDCTPFPTNTGGGSIEVMESTAPLRFHKREMLIDSGGSGQFRGGVGQEIVVEVTSPKPSRLSTLADRVDHAAQGILGGTAGAPTVLSVDGTTMPPKARATVAAGAKLTIHYAGGGGYGDPHKRNPESIAADIKNGLVSSEAARRDYGFEVGFDGATK